MKKFKKNAILLAAVIMLSACGNGSTPSNNDDNEQTDLASEWKSEAQSLADDMEGDILNAADFILRNNTNEATEEPESGDADGSEESTEDNSDDSYNDPYTESDTEDDIAYPITLELTGNDYDWARPCSSFVGNLTLIECHIPDEFPKRYYPNFKIIDLTGNELLTFTAENAAMLCKDRIYANKIFKTDDEQKDCVIDSSGNIIVGNSDHDYDDIICYSDNYVCVRKIESGFNGNTYKFGVIDFDGNWIVPISSDLNLLKQNKIDFTDPQNWEKSINNHSAISYIGGNIIEFYGYGNTSKYCQTVYYDFINDNVIDNEDVIFQNAIIYNNYTYMYHNDNNSNKGIYKYNPTNNTCESVYYDKELKGCVLLDDVFLAYYKDYEYMPQERYKIIDYNGNLVADLSEYQFYYWSNCGKYKEAFDYKNGQLLTLCTGKDAEPYICLINSDGSLAFEPIKFNTNNKDSTLNYNKLLRFYNDTIVAYSDKDKTITKYDLTGNVIKSTYIPGEIYIWDDKICYDFESGSVITKDNVASSSVENYYDSNGNLILTVI